MKENLKNTYIVKNNLEVLRNLDDKSFEFIYMDPPYNTGRDFGHFDDKWSSMKDYREFLRPVLIECQRLLKDDGNIAVHIEPKISHHVRMVLDSVMGESNFRNSIVWKTGGNKKTSYFIPRRHDEIIVYSKNKNKKPIFNPQYKSYDETYKKKNAVKKCPKTGREYVTSACHNAQPDIIKREKLRYKWNGHDLQWWWSKELMQKRHDEDRLIYNKRGIPRIKKYLDEMEGIPLNDVWDDISAPAYKEKLDYATQKPVALLERLVKIYTNTGDTVLDPFAGSGTTARAAISLDRDYLMIDINKHGKEQFEKSLSQIEMEKTKKTS